MRLLSLVTFVAALSLGILRPVGAQLVEQAAEEPIPTGLMSKYFGLTVIEKASACFLTCHNAATQVALLPGRGINSAVFVTDNCKLPLWIKIMSDCLPAVCKSAPDVAYALEYGQSWCHRAGVNNATFDLPDWYMASPGGQFYKNTLLSGARDQRAAGILLATGAVLWLLIFRHVV